MMMTQATNRSGKRLLILICAVGLLFALGLFLASAAEMDDDIWEALHAYQTENNAPPPKCSENGPRLTKTEWMQLNDLYQKIPPPAQSELYNLGDHYLVYRVLVRELGFKDTPTDALDMWRFLEDLLCGGYADE